MFIKDDTGSMIGAKNGKLLGCVDPLLAKAMSCREVLSWIKELNLTKVIVESDALMLVQAFEHSTSHLSYFGSILCDCQILAKDLSEFHLVHVNRSVNVAAYTLARAAFSESDRGSWNLSPPPFLFDVLAIDNN